MCDYRERGPLPRSLGSACTSRHHCFRRYGLHSRRNVHVRQHRSRPVGDGWILRSRTDPGGPPVRQGGRHRQQGAAGGSRQNRHADSPGAQRRHSSGRLRALRHLPVPAGRALPDREDFPDRIRRSLPENTGLRAGACDSCRGRQSSQVEDGTQDNC